MSTLDALLFRGVEIGDRPNQDCLVVNGVVAAIGSDIRHDRALDISGHGGALIPGLADHHLHLFAMAASMHSFDLSEHRDVTALRRFAVPGGWVRVVGWDEHHGDLDRDRLDQLVGRRPIRVQHRSGALWVLNTAALQLTLGNGDAEPAGAEPAGAERDGSGRLTGRFWRADQWLRDTIGDLPDLADVANTLASFGVTSVTDATPDHDTRALRHLIRAVHEGRLPQRLQLMCSDVPHELPDRVSVGPRKLVVADHDLPHPDDLAADIRAVHGVGRAVAVHCVSREALALTLAALGDAGVKPGDRIEHCAIADAAAVAELAALNLTVVTQPSFVARRGDRYLRTHDAADHDDLWRYASLAAAGVPTAASSDAPYGDPDPWATIRAARDRTTSSGAVLGQDERMSADRTIAGFLAALDKPGGPPRKVEVGAPADLVLLDGPFSAVLADPTRDRVAMTMAAGRAIFQR